MNEERRTLNSTQADNPVGAGTSGSAPAKALWHGECVGLECATTGSTSPTDRRRLAALGLVRRFVGGGHDMAAAGRCGEHGKVGAKMCVADVRRCRRRLELPAANEDDGSAEKTLSVRST